MFGDQRMNTADSRTDIYAQTIGRNRALDTVLRYLSLHLSPGLNGLQSLDVLRSLF